MSLVGPRPMPTWVYDRVRAPEFHRRSSVLPGMTGLWQVNGREQNLERRNFGYVFN
jgi:lipopolysaccharide/colanic/teichoic acid biosynthesis glycosyltransferase